MSSSAAPAVLCFLAKVPLLHVDFPHSREVDPRVAPPGGEDAAPEPATSEGAGSSSNGGTLTGMAAVEQVFHFLDGPADVLSAATACRRWRALACADSVWRARFRREKLLEKARLFEVALPPVPVQGGQAGRGAAAAAAAALVKDEAAGVGLAFYARVFALKVAQVIVVLRSLRAVIATRASHQRPSHSPPPPPCRGTR